MKIAKVKWEGRITAAIIDDDVVRPIPNYDLLGLIERSEIEKIPLPDLARTRASTHPLQTPALLPLQPREVWASGSTYESNVALRDAGREAGPGYYGQAFRGPRPEIFFKGTARNCVGPGEPIGIRPDSKLTIPEPELAVVLGSHGSVVGYTIAIDVTAWDLERENPLYQPQAKVYDASCALGPVILTADELPDPYGLEISCTIVRGGETIFSEASSTSLLHRRIETLVEYLLRANNVPRGSVLLTGAGIAVPESAALQPGDLCTVSIPEIGVLSNPAVLLA